MTTIGKYEIIEEIGRGGFAVVYKARDPTLDRIVALKVLHSYWSEDASFVSRFQREARVVANLRHPHIVTVHEVGEAEGQLFIAMDYLPGHTLHDLLEERGVFTLEDTLSILTQLADALDYAHSQGMIHRDIKPRNVMVEMTERGAHVTLMDFGLVKAAGDSSVLTSQGMVLGSPEYMAPEQADPNRKDEIGPATDRYALGVVAYRMLVGRVPFPGNTPATLNAHLNLEPPNPQMINEELHQDMIVVLLKMLAKKPENRWRTSALFLSRLRSYQEGIHFKESQGSVSLLSHRFWLAWALATLIGGLLGLALSYTGSLMVVILIQAIFDRSEILSVMLMTLSLVGFGTAMTLGQWLVLKKYNYVTSWKILETLAGWLVSWAGGVVIALFLAMIIRDEYSFLERASSWITFVGLPLGLVIGNALVGILQWASIKQKSEKAGYWLLVTFTQVIGILPALFIWFLVGFNLVFLLLLFVVYTIFPGLVMNWILKSSEVGI